MNIVPNVPKARDNKREEVIPPDSKGLSHVGGMNPPTRAAVAKHSDQNMPRHGMLSLGNRSCPQWASW